MHPILFRIPLPHMPLKLWWALAAVVAIAFVYAVLGQRRGDKSAAGFSILFAIAAAVGAYAFREVKYEGAALPIYSYGVMLGVSLVVGWYLTLTLAERDGLPKETMANCYVVTAIAAVAGSRLLYIATNPAEFNQISDVFALRRGGLVAYGGFIGGYVGSWAYLARHKIRLLPWADVAVPSLASGLLITRIGCYLFGCDFGKRLPAGAPDFLKKLGTFPHWAQSTLESGDGSPAYVRHLDLFKGTPLGQELVKTNASLPVHPTQIYESLCGLALLLFLLWQRKHQKFRGQIFFSFVFGYGFLRFLLEIIRDDSERGEFPPMMSEHILVPGALSLMSLAFVFGIALGIKNPTVRTVARVLAIVPPIAAYLILKPQSFAHTSDVELSTSQWIALASALIVAYFYAKYWEIARKNPTVAMGMASLGDFNEAERKKSKKHDEESEDEESAEASEEAESEEAASEEADDADGGKKKEEAEEEAPKPKKKREKGLVAKGKKDGTSAATPQGSPHEKDEEPAKEPKADDGDEAEPAEG